MPLGVEYQNVKHKTGQWLDVVTPALRVVFPVQGAHLPADHGYPLYAALTHLVPALHRAPWLGVELISGLPQGKGVIALPPHGTRLYLRIPVDRFADVLPLAGKRLEIGGYPVRLGIPLARPLVPASSLYARIVTIKPCLEPEPFLEAARRQIVTLGIEATLTLSREGRSRRIVTIQGKKVVGFSLAAHGLSAEDSLTLQSRGLGGRRRMGCGLFNAITNAHYAQGRAA
jgi:CRISPR-associated protein Cas6